MTRLVLRQNPAEEGAAALAPVRHPQNLFGTLPHLQELLVRKRHDAFEDDHVGAVQGFLRSEKGRGWTGSVRWGMPHPG